jgi:AmiR/NasT family two-component response regulator
MSQEQADPVPMTRQQLQGKRVVVCEDEGITVMQLQKVLPKMGMEVVGVATEGRAAVDLVCRVKPDIVLMDITMQGMDGLEATRRIMHEQPTCIVMLTAYSDAENIEKARIYGAAGYMQKPIDSAAIVKALGSALHQFYNCMP